MKSLWGQLLLCGSRIIARAHNLTERLKDVTAHAEMQAITSAANYLNGKYLDGCTLYVTLEPCVYVCRSLNLESIRRDVVYGASDPKEAFSKLHLRLHPKTNCYGGLMAEEAKAYWMTFFAKKGNKKSTSF